MGYLMPKPSLKKNINPKLGMDKGFRQWPRKTRVQSQVKSYQRLKRMVLDISLLNTKHYNVRKQVKLATIVKGDPKAPFLIATTPKCRKGATPFPRILHFTLDLYLIMLNVKQGGIKYHFLKVRTKDKVEQSKERRGTFPNLLVM